MWDGSFHRIGIKGTAGALLWGYHTAATLTAWTIRKGQDGQWILHATLGHSEKFFLKQTPLLFAAPREKGLPAWAVEAITVGTNQVRAKLGPPEH